MARFLPDSGALFQHVPRTGGTFVQEALTALAVPTTHWTKRVPDSPKKHSLLNHYYPSYMVEVKLIFAFVRHPVDYYSSVWRYLHDARQVSRRRFSLTITKHRWHPFKQAALLYKPDFCEWVDAMVEAEPAWATRLFESYVGPEDGEFCQFIGRTETVRSDLANLLIHFNYRIDPADLIKVPKANKSLSPPPDIPDELRNRICRQERVLIRRFYGHATMCKRWYGLAAS